ncbi:MAG: neutral/alkaline non-lysosomal ceramidase N-terminal domain-containing protein [Sandaracinaceae bacterium]|nr:neutral/alkaline non-lysosomal ceramidase N-terminal domain-containing protein [Myxococcales bacterium]MCB9656923.1 neutral/alkaline non-lysosomal ceramidase N-terminal domain-containing protein [Sandaracinaceae bacterium]
MSTKRAFVAGVFVTVVASCLGGGCAPTLVLGAPRTTSTRTGTGGLRAAAATVDVTPPPGLGLFGHGPEARRARGHRGRLRCRALVLEDAQGSRVALVACDLAAISAALHREVAMRVHAATGLGLERIVLSATHTHAGPAHYFADGNYAGGFSSQVTGYDPRVTDRLATRIAGAIVDATARLEPARLSTVEERLVGPSDAERAIGQNRSLEAHCLNTAPMGALATTCDTPLRDPYAEVEGMLSMLVVEALGDGAPHPLAIYASYPVHATSVPNTNDLYHADLFGEAVRTIEAGVGAPGFVAVLANGAEGDVRPDYVTQRFDESLHLGRALGTRVLAAIARRTPVDAPRVAAAFEDLSLSRATGDGARLCAHPELGRASAGGSEEGRTGFYRFPRWREGSRDDSRGGCHGPRAPLPFRNISSNGFPSRAPLSVVAVGPVTIVAIPAEATTTVGIRLRQRVAAARPGPVMLVGLANDYLQYVTTAEEYGLQHYEGASTLYGPGTARVLGAHFAALAQSIATDDPTVSASPLRARVRFRERLSDERRSRGPVVEAVVRHRYEGHVAYSVALRASDAALLLEDGSPIARVEHRRPEGFVPARDALGYALDDLGPHLIVRQQGRRRLRRGHYQITFVVPDQLPAGAYRIVVRSAGVEAASAPFGVGVAP